MHISELTGCSSDHKILVLIDNHESHLSIAAIDKARDLGIVLLTIPPKHPINYSLSMYLFMGHLKLDTT